MSKNPIFEAKAGWPFMKRSPAWTEFGELPNSREALKSGDLRAALSGFAMEQMLDLRASLETRTDSPAIGFGTTLWLLGDFCGAAIVWANVCDAAIGGRYTQSECGTFKGGLLLWFASVWFKKGDWDRKPDVLTENLHDK